ncbi:Arc family DNA-binding protein [Knoellia sp. S7-12]|uniref:FitA-like ribbon-helix-helix domain-containing protein n=1 Tax=Knoellia sp. S7-12 TaxID=3126698 RepID=UPI003367FAF5
MSTLTIRQVDEDVKKRLQVRAARNGRSMEAEVRAILTEAVSIDAAVETEDPLFAALRDFRRLTGGLELDIPSRADDIERPVPDFS